MSKEVLRLALEALEFDSFYGTKKQEAITALREALAALPAQQEPVEVPTTSYEHRKFVLVGREWYERFAAFHDDCQIGEQLTWQEKTIRQQSYENGWNDAQRYLREPQASPPAPPKPLTDEQVNLFINGRGDEDDDDYVEPTGDGFGLSDADLVRLVRRVEAAHGIKGGA